MPLDCLTTQLRKLGEYDATLNESENRQRLREIATTRHITCWADHSTIAGHTYVLYTFSCLYDEAVFLTQKELNEKGISMDIEETLSKPQIHIIARCSSSDEDTIAYAEERRECLQSLTTPVTSSTGLEFHDVLLYGATLSKLFGNSDKDVMALDRAKHATKQRPSSVTLRTKFKEFESRASTRVLQLYKYCNQEVSEWGKKFIMEHSVFPPNFLCHCKGLCNTETIACYFSQCTF